MSTPKIERILDKGGNGSFMKVNAQKMIVVLASKSNGRYESNARKDDRKND